MTEDSVDFMLSTPSAISASALVKSSFMSSRGSGYMLFVREADLDHWNSFDAN
ncbi:hypothetical protein PC129_g17732 [Phytophthora cactorum]|uniref:Uncharacterized protein n=1 Tax=Phytophthora cactorum TaxID=29920 RepID=A0A8T1K0P1_9STRA|nr:hypothetical protein Pcac1_g21747 [Phytophthora cactorum]KAG2803794.1 hypothetical protein PC112_g19011 [Phytophthora cactorum]KAG2804979.1 hypothetical protein PC111_g18027 [Phytophthora cactorum]KAG2841872.1 hypothetical protein PC113_g18935 [Phytophthora cactorum]KAG2883355.1 hypothetical protein PC114_g20631 [Phytophthora cactorum]